VAAVANGLSDQSTALGIAHAGAGQQGAGLGVLLEEKSMHDTAWRALQGRLRKPPAWLLVSGPEALQWQSRLQPVLNQLPEPLTLFVQPHPLAMPAPAMPGWDHTTAAVICRGLECSSPVRDLDYLLEALQDG